MPPEAERSTRGWTAAAAGLFASALLVAACAAPRPPQPAAPTTGAAPGETAPARLRVEDLTETATATQPGMTCRQAAGTARGALLRLGYEVLDARAPAPGEPGEVQAVKHTGWTIGQPGSDYHAIVELRCDNRGVELVAFTDESFFGRLAFQRDFAEQVAAVAARRVNRPSADTAPGPARRLEITLEPLRDGGRGAFGSDISATGMTPVHVLIRNGTTRAYGFAVARLQLVSQEGERRQALAPTEVRRRAAPELGDALAAKMLADATIEPGSNLEGYLFFPASTYRRGSAVLMDLENDEAEGMSIEF